MSSKSSTEVIIGGKVYTLSGYEGEEYLQRVAAYLNGKLSECEQLESFRHLPMDMRNILVQLNVADDYFKAREQVERLEEELERVNTEVYDLKHDLISAQLKTEEVEKNANELVQENKELILSKTRLEASLEEVLFDTGRSGTSENKMEEI